jgi:glycosyltransferase involved in cell wall biosynthesis
MVIWRIIVSFIKNLHGRRKRRNERLGQGISLLVPFKTDGAERERAWSWLRQYWACQLPKAQIVEQSNEDAPFRKTRAINEAYKRATGDVICILDADAYLDAEVILEAARRIREDLHYWAIPYRRLYRLTESASNLVVSSDPADPLKFSDPPPASVYVNESGQSIGHWFGAMVQIFPREAFEVVNGADDRFAGWGGEDASLMKAIDTLYHRHKTLDSPVYHLWHPTSAGKWFGTKTWKDQGKATNSKLTTRYGKAFNDSAKMRALVSEPDHGSL